MSNKAKFTKLRHAPVLEHGGQAAHMSKSSIWKKSQRRGLAPAAEIFAAAVQEDPAVEAEREEAAWRQRSLLAIEDDQALARRLEAQGCVLAEAGRFHEARARLDEAVRRDPKCATAHEALAQVLLEQGLAFEAVRAAEAACECRPAWAVACLTLGRAQRNLGELRLALGSCDAALHRAAADADADAGEEEEARAEALEVERLLVLQRVRSGGVADGGFATREALRAEAELAGGGGSDAAAPCEIEPLGILEELW
jgi:tetratricopeptide (TPR) repeat protein